jgi:hypothetical protein
MAKQSQGSKPKIATLPGGGASAKLADYLKEAGPSAKAKGSKKR